MNGISFVQKVVGGMVIKAPSRFKADNNGSTLICLRVDHCQSQLIGELLESIDRLPALGDFKVSDNRLTEALPMSSGFIPS
ncbi:hypothetical protein J1N35_031272 [Gossypium stocksii]|uniref:Uncharacterized protein n=1 Tax=Gossypium stocksii TaxID=47602 RepID=A0A9D3V0U3_9ROSI|nr:hypothetical protein J1N35_031272 [Gossypium stocksii]